MKLLDGGAEKQYWKDMVKMKALQFGTDLESLFASRIRAGVDEIPVRTRDTEADVIDIYVDVILGTAILIVARCCTCSPRMEEIVVESVRQKFARLRELGLAPAGEAPKEDMKHISKEGDEQ